MLCIIAILFRGCSVLSCSSVFGLNLVFNCASRLICETENYTQILNTMLLLTDFVAVTLGLSFNFFFPFILTAYSRVNQSEVFRWALVHYGDYVSWSS